LAKPFDSSELLLRIKAILRRSDHAGTKKNREILIARDLLIDYKSRTVKKNGEIIELTSKEFDLLWLLASNPKQVFTRNQLIYQVWNSEYYQDSAIVTMLIKRLREKIEPDEGSPIYIKTVRGVGYKFGE
jgi:DNA-binding response OmpR family regulator